MGAYASKPVTDKICFQGNNECLSFGGCTMQGWRISQEDAHNASIDFDKSTSLFAVYDGHGGHEVAEYTAEKLPEFIRNTKSYSEGELSQALTEAFLKFDESLVIPEVLDILKDIAGTKDTNGPDSDREEVDNLCKEASMPLDEVIAKYSANKFQSPHVKPKAGSSSISKDGCSAGESGSSSCVVNKINLDDSENEECKEEKITPNEGTSSVVDTSMASKSSSPESRDKLCNGNATEVSNCKSSENQKCSSNKEVDDKEDINGISCEENSLKKDSESELHNSSEVGHSNETNCKEIESTKISNGAVESPAVKKGGKGTGHSKGKNVVKKSELEQTKKHVTKRLAAAKAEEIYRQIQEGQDLEHDSDLDEEEEDEEEEIVDGDIEEEDEDDSEEEEEEDIEDDSDDEAEGEDVEPNDCFVTMTDKPSYDCGCTACVTILRGNELIVGNVGDSRCVVCRNGEAFDMSIDHKPEDELECERITKAGGRVTRDGRVNGGLNLSRALGDHSYKQNTDLPPEEQMISPFPDVKSLTLESKDRFMILACDGIWNSMSSQEACDFVTKRLDCGDKLTTICEEMFDYCLAPDTMGDGAGCDNMTCIIVLFNFHDEESHKENSTASKRPLTVISSTEDGTKPVEKKLKLDTDTS